MRRIPVADLQPAPYNPRKDLKPGDAEYEQIKASIAAFGLVDPLVWNARTGNLVGGHQRLKVLRNEFAVTEVDVSVVELDDAREKALNLALNRIRGDWDAEKLAEVFAELAAQPDFDAAITGFDLEEIERLTKDLTAEATEGTEQEKAPEAGQMAHSYKVIAECASARQQKQIVSLLEAKGVACHTRTVE